MSRVALLMAALCAALSGCAGADAFNDGASGPQYRVLQTASTGLLQPQDRPPAPTIRGETLDGGRLDVADMRGSVVVVNFWAHDCPPCRAEAKYLVKVAQDNAAKGVRFIGVNTRDSRSAALRFDDKHGIPYPSLFDQPGVLLTRFRSIIPQSPPSTLLIDKRGRIAGLFRGGVTEVELSGPVQALAGETI